MTEIPYPQPFETPQAFTPAVEAEPVDQATETTLAFVATNIEAFKLTNNLRPVRHHETSPY